MNRSELVSKLELVSHALADHDLVPMFKNFCFDGKTVSAYNDVLGIVAPCTTDEFAVSGATLLGLLKNSHSEEVEFKLEKEDIVVKTGKSRFRLPYFTKDEFLFEPPANKWTSKLVIDDHLLKGLEACLLTSSRDTAQPALLGVGLRETTNCVGMYSSDGDSITRYYTKAKAATDTPCMLPNTFCEAILRTMKETKCENGILHIHKEWAMATLDSEYVIYGRLIEIATPLDYEAEIAATIKGKVPFVALPKGLDHALSRARVIADPTSAKTTIDVVDGKMILHTESHMGLVSDALPLPKHPDVSVDVFAATVQRAIGLCDEIAILEGCTVYRQGTTLFMVVGNMG